MTNEKYTCRPDTAMLIIPSEDQGQPELHSDTIVKKKTITSNNSNKKQTNTHAKKIPWGTGFQTS
jgi:hypothetical protein